MIFIALGSFVFLSMMGIAFAAFTLLAELRLSSEDERAANLRRLWRWAIKGLAVPLVIWALMNVGFTFELQPFMPKLQITPRGLDWLNLYAAYLGAGFAVISSYWSALSLIWMVWRSGRGLEEEIRTHYFGLCWISITAMTLPAIFFLWLGGWLTLGLAVTAMLAPIAGYGPEILRPKKPAPMYSGAIARMKFGKYAEAEAEVIRQLEKCEDDFQGWLMLADLYANQFNDVAEAEATILEICDQPRTSPTQLSVALHRLADWHLKHNSDPDAARRALEVIVHRLPGTHLAHMAQVRASQLPYTSEELREQQEKKPVYLPALHDPLDDANPEPVSPLSAEAAAARAKQLEARLKAHPDDISPREELARLLAGPLGKPTAAIAHIEKLMTLPESPPERIAGWLGLIAAWQIAHLHDRDAGRATLRRVINEYPGTPTAFAAQRRLLHLDTEDKVQKSKPPAPPRFRIEMDSGNSPAKS